MKLDILISKYLDGDLTRLEDEELRLLLASDPAAKVEFDTSVALHLTMQEDSDLEDLPEEDFLQIENNILAAVQPVFADTVASSQPRIYRLNVRRLASAAAAILLISSIPVADTFFDRGNSGSVAALTPVPVQSDITKSALQKFHSRRNVSKTQVTVPEEGSVNTILAESDNINTITTNSQPLPVQVPVLAATEPVVPQNSEVFASGYGEYASSNTIISPDRVSDVVPSFAVNAALNRTPNGGDIRADASFVNFADGKSLEVQMTTFVGNGLLKVGSNPATAATSVSQSIAYAVNGDNRVGIEVGYTGYSVTDGGTIAVPVAIKVSGKSGGTVQSNDDGLPKSPSQSDKPGEYEAKSVTFTNNKTVFWGSAFYERTLIDKGDLTVNARLGAGGSPEGPMAFGRAFARYTVLTGVSLTLGAESRVLALRAPVVEDLHKETSTGISVVYGVQVKF